MKNSFTETTHFLFMVENEYRCAYCGINHANSGHHILGRGKSEGCEKSPLNYAPLNNHECHLPFHENTPHTKVKSIFLNGPVTSL